jgi:hypothetical protein
MARFKQGIHGGFNGRVGNVVGSTWKGQGVMKIRPASVTNPNTEKQQDQRSRFGLMMRFLGTHQKLIRIGFRPYAIRMTAFNAAMSRNMAEAIEGSSPDFSINYSMVSLSKGELPAITQATVAYVSPVSVKLNWNNNSSYQGAHSTDKLQVSIFDAESFKSQSFISCAARSESSVTLALPAEWAGRFVDVFAFFLAEAGVGASSTKMQVSDTVYAGGLALE